MNVKEVLDKTTQFFRSKSIDSPRLDSELLISSALGLNRIDLYIKFEQPLREDEVQRCRDYVKRRAQGEPVAYILGRKDFFGNSFFVDSNVLIPRPETEIIVEETLSYLKKNEMTAPRILDIGCGSGCIGLSLKKNIPGATLQLLDSSPGALEVAKKNSIALALTEGVEFICADATTWQPTLAAYDVVVSNPPYISADDNEVEETVRLYEPQAALFSNDNGLAHIFKWSEKYAAFLACPGVMVFEMGYTQGAQVLTHFKKLSMFTGVQLIKDLSQLDRTIVARVGGI